MKFENQQSENRKNGFDNCLKRKSKNENYKLVKEVRLRELNKG